MTFSFNAMHDNPVLGARCMKVAGKISCRWVSKSKAITVDYHDGVRLTVHAQEVPPEELMLAKQVVAWFEEVLSNV